MAVSVYESALGNVVAAVVAALRADAGLQAHLHTNPAGRAPDAFARVYDEGNVPPDLQGRWITLGGPREQWARSIGRLRGGSVVGVLVHLWHNPAPGDDIGRGISYGTWAHVARTITAKLALAGGFTMMYGAPELVDIFKDTDGRSWHGTARYQAHIRGA